jgi:hypothetical protein
MFCMVLCLIKQNVEFDARPFENYLNYGVEFYYVNAMSYPYKGWELEIYF